MNYFFFKRKTFSASSFQIKIKVRKFNIKKEKEIHLLLSFFSKWKLQVGIQQQTPYTLSCINNHIILDISFLFTGNNHLILGFFTLINICITNQFPLSLCFVAQPFYAHIFKNANSTTSPFSFNWDSHHSPTIFPSNYNHHKI